jgi:hypothetical protein
METFLISFLSLACYFQGFVEFSHEFAVDNRDQGLDVSLDHWRCGPGSSVDFAQLRG